MKSLNPWFIDTQVFFDHLSKRYDIDDQHDPYDSFLETLPVAKKQRLSALLDHYVPDEDEDLRALCMIYLIQYYYL